MDRSLPADRRIAQSCRMLEQLMGEDVDYEQVAAAIGLSLYRFHHLFTEAMGETPGDYLRRVRLDTAATRLRWTRESVGRIATAVGYSSQPSFNKAFIRRYGVSPIAFRNDRERWPNEPTDAVPDKRIRLVRSEGFHLLGKRYIGRPCFMADYWEDFLANLPEGMDRPGQHLFVGLLRDDMRFTLPDQVRYDCCVTVSEAFEAPEVKRLWPHLESIVIEPGLCASLAYQGYYAASVSPDGKQSISQAYSLLFDDWMTQGRHTFAGEYAAEIYAVPHTRCPPEDIACTILAPVR